MRAMLSSSLAALARLCGRLVRGSGVTTGSERSLGDIELIFAVNDTIAIDVVAALTTVAVPLREAGSEAMRLALSRQLQSACW